MTDPLRKRIFQEGERVRVVGPIAETYRDTIGLCGPLPSRATSTATSSNSRMAVPIRFLDSNSSIEKHSSA